jgi:DNA-binding GntR family transcriptional regulator
MSGMDPQSIYEDLRQKIVWLELKPGLTLNLVELSESYKVSRNPVMIALTRLDAEEWVVRNGVHFVVSPLTVDRMREITEIRSIMEMQAVLWAMNRISPEGLAELKTLRQEIKGCSQGMTKKEIVNLDYRFHCLLYRETQNTQLHRLLERLLCHYLRFWLSSPQEIRPDDFFRETLDIIKAIEAKDEIRLKAAASAHIKVSLDKIMGFA